MLITMKENENKNEDQKIKAYFNIEMADFQLKGFKLYENEENELKMLMPSMMLKDKEGNTILDENTKKPKNMQVIQINPELANRKKLFEELEKIFVDTYNEGQGKKNEKGIFAKEVENQSLEKGELNVTTFNIPSKKSNTTNNDIQLKSSNSVYLGAFKINNVNLFYNTLKNDWSISMPQNSYINKDGAEVKNNFLVPKNPNAHKVLKTKIISSHKNKQNEFSNMMKYKNQNQGFNQNQAPQEAQAPAMK